MSGRTVRRFVDGLLRGQRTERARPDDFEAARDEDGHRVARRTHGQRLTARGVRHRSASPAGCADGRGPAGRRPLVVGAIRHPTPGRHRHRARGGVGGHRDRGRPQPARPDPDGQPRPRHLPRVCSNPTRVPGMRSGASADLPKGEHSHSTSARSGGSSTGPTPNWRRSPASARIRAASSGWMRRKVGCVARATRRRSRWRVRR